uniref:Leucine rich repeat and fibronectin type III domain containing 2 n=1 Tax=Eptatretus burgeri TaxID=7764 RepID=A0A8C4QIA3_EPTBU
MAVQLLPCLFVLVVVSIGPVSARCPRRCVCQNLSPSMATLCAKKGLLAIPLTVDRQTVELRLSDNFIARLKHQDLANITGLVDLTLSRNTLGEIMPGTFADLHSLRSLYLDGNRLTYFDSATLRGLTSLRLLTASNNQLGHVADNAFNEFVSSMEDLDLSYNNLRTLPWSSVRRMNGLHTLALDHNLLEFIAEGAFSLLHRLTRLDLTSNRLHSLAPDPIFSQPPAAQLGSMTLSLAGNPLHCNCELLWLRRQHRKDFLETCAAPQVLAGRSFWAVPEEEFICQSPIITRRSTRQLALEGQRAVLRCRAAGDPQPVFHWLSPDGRLVHNSSRAIIYNNGTLDLLVTTARDDGTFTCIASNAAGQTMANVVLAIVHLPRIVDPSSRPSDPGALDTAALGRKFTIGTRAGSRMQTSGELPNVHLIDVAPTTAVVSWKSSQHLGDVRIYQVQYNGSSDGSLIYRMVMAPSLSCSLVGLAPSTAYDVCVAAIHDDGTTEQVATRLLGCAAFRTLHAPEGESLHCASVNSSPAVAGRLLGGTMIIAIGGVIVACLLVFTVILVVGFKACGSGTRTVTPTASGKPSILPRTQVQSPTRGFSTCRDGGQLPDDDCNGAWGDIRISAQCDAMSPSPLVGNTASKLLSTKDQLHPSKGDTMAVTSMPDRIKRRSLPTHQLEDEDPLLVEMGGSRWSGSWNVNRRSFSFDAGASPGKLTMHTVPGALGQIWTKRSLSLNGIFFGLKEEQLATRHRIFSSSDWILESTV